MCNSTNSTDDTCKVEYLQALGYLPLFLLGFGLNIAALRAFIAGRESWKDTHIYMFNLNISDFALILFLPFRILDAVVCLPKNHFCTFLIFTHYINMYSSIMTTTAICVHRFLAIRFPLQARSWRKKKKVAIGVCLGIWVILLTVCIGYREESYPDKLCTCYERHRDERLDGGFMLLLIFLGFLVPLLITVYCSSRIIYILSRGDDRSEEKRSTIGMVTANMVVFIVCYTPVHISFLVKYYIQMTQTQNGLKDAHYYLLVSEWIATTNCCFDSISYYFLLRRFYSDTSRPTGVNLESTGVDLQSKS